MWAATPPAACHAQIDRRFFDAFQLHAPVEFAPGACVPGRRLGVGLSEQVFHRAFDRTIADDHEVPRLHEPHRPGMVRRRQESHHHVIRNRRRQKIPAHVAALENRPIHGIPFRR
jgi:hypothetical protein